MTAEQSSLFEVLPPRPDLSFEGRVRLDLDPASWVESVPGWMHRHAALFDELRATGRFAQRTRRMAGRAVREPRMVAAWQADDLAVLPPRLEQLRARLSAEYDVTFDSVLVNLYRDGDDAVAWHGDTVRHRLRDPLVATVSLGARRRFLLRPRGGGGVRARYSPGEGDLLVMGGACQHDWEHTVPRERTAGTVGPRMSVTLRHSR